MAERLADSPDVAGRVVCRACRLDVTDEPALRGVRTCPRCGRGVRSDGSNSAPRPRAEVRCVQCGFDVGAIPGSTPTVRCPECGCSMDLLRDTMLEPWPGEAAAIRRMLGFFPLGVACYLAAVVVLIAINLGAPGPIGVWGVLAFCVLINCGEAVVRARAIVRASVPVRERTPAVLRLGAIGVGLTAACWLPVILITLLMLQ